MLLFGYREWRRVGNSIKSLQKAYQDLREVSWKTADWNNTTKPHKKSCSALISPRTKCLKQLFTKTVDRQANNYENKAIKHRHTFVNLKNMCPTKVLTCHIKIADKSARQTRQSERMKINWTNENHRHFRYITLRWKYEWMIF